METDDAFGAVVSRTAGIEAEAVGIHALIEGVGIQAVGIGSATVVGINVPMAVTTSFCPIAFVGGADGLVA